MPPCAAMNAPAIVVELAGRDARPEVLADVRDRRGDEIAGTGDALDLLGPLADDHRGPASAASISAKTSSTVPPASSVHERPGRPVALDDRLGLLVVDGEAPRHHLGRVVAASLVARAPEHARASPSRRRDRRRARCRAAGRSPRSISSSASAWTRFRGNPSSTKPPAASSCESRSRISAIVSSSGTSSPEARIGSTWRPSSVPVRDRGAEHVARRHVGHAVGSGDPLRLRALPGSLRAEDEDVDRRYLRKPS